MVRNHEPPPGVGSKFLDLGQKQFVLTSGSADQRNKNIALSQLTRKSKSNFFLPGSWNFEPTLGGGSWFLTMVEILNGVFVSRIWMRIPTWLVSKNQPDLTRVSDYGLLTNRIRISHLMFALLTSFKEITVSSRLRNFSTSDVLKVIVWNWTMILIENDMKFDDSYWKWFLLKMILIENDSYWKWFLLKIILIENDSYWKWFLLKM
jgi:hypothetical protein